MTMAESVVKKTVPSSADYPPLVLELLAFLQREEPKNLFPLGSIRIADLPEHLRSDDLVNYCQHYSLVKISWIPEDAPNYSPETAGQRLSIGAKGAADLAEWRLTDRMPDAVKDDGQIGQWFKCAWYDKHSNELLDPDQLRKARNDGRLTEWRKVGSRYQHELNDVCRCWPEHKAALEAAAKPEIERKESAESGPDRKLR